MSSLSSPVNTGRMVHFFDYGIPLAPSLYLNHSQEILPSTSYSQSNTF